MKSFNLIIAMLALMTIMASCSDENDAVLLDNETFTSEIEITDSVKVNQTEINNIVEDILSRPQSRQSDYTIETISDDNGKELMFVVNYSNNAGFVVISATKNYYPVLAYNYKGNFNIEGDMPLGLSMWNEGIKENIKYVNRLPSDSVIAYRALWRKYEAPSQMGFTSRSLESDISAAQLILMDSVDCWQRANMQVSAIPQEGINDWQEQSEIEELVRNSIYPLYEDNMYDLSRILHRYRITCETINNFVLSTWKQDGLYQQSLIMNDGSLALAGCGPVAIGQVMRYYEYPSSFDWASMPLTQGCKNTSDLLLDIINRAGATLGVNGTPVNTNQMLTAMRSYGYNMSNGSHNFSTVRQNLRLGKPVILMAKYFKQTGEETGHAWVASGMECFTELIQDEVWTFTGKRTFQCIKEYNTQRIFTDYLYMNWGWSDDKNGYFIDNQLRVPESISIATNREMIYNITPND